MDIQQIKQALLGEKLPCDFRLDGVPFTENEHAKHAVWEKVSESEFRCTVIDESGLTLIAFCKDFESRGVELRLTLHNAGSKISPRISDIRSLILKVPNSEKNDERCYHYRRILYAQGSHAIAEDFMPREYALCLGKLKLDMTEARSSSGIMPYFNVMQDEENGVFAAVGWTGHWCAEFEPDMTVIFSYPRADFTLASGESVDLPSALLVPWHADSNDDHNPESFNIFRHFIKDYIVPHVDGKPIDGAVCLRSWGGFDKTVHNICWDNIKKYSLPSDAYGIDAGWHDIECVERKDWYANVGDWNPDPKIFPKETENTSGGLTWLADGGRAAGSKGFWLWIEFERAVCQSESVREHPEYFYLSPYGETDNQIRMDNDEARHWILNRLLHIFRETKITIFRVDYNFDPGTLFAHYDAETGNIGLTELRYYNGLYRFFDELKAEMPDLVIDNCASGGRRLDYRMYQYAVPLMCRSDFFCFTEEFDPTGAQAHTMALARYLPVQADSCGSCMGTTPIMFDTYRVRSSMACGVGLAAPTSPLSEKEGKWYREILTEAMAVKPYMSMNFYPLTGYSLSQLDWAAWQTVSDDGERALVMAFRRELSLTEKMMFALHGLVSDAIYEITDSKGNVLGKASGKMLSDGYSVTLPEKRSSAVHFLRIVKN